MERQDYILKEIEKIGSVLRYVVQKILDRRTEETTITPALKEEYNGFLFEELNMDIRAFLAQKDEESVLFLQKQKGFNLANIELLAQTLYQMGAGLPKEEQTPYLKRALYIYCWCNTASNSFSLERSAYITKINHQLSKMTPAS